MWDVMGKVVESLLKSFVNSPLDLFLLLIIIWQFYTQERRDREFIKLVNNQIQDAERQGKMITLMEVLVGRKKI